MNKLKAKKAIKAAELLGALNPELKYLRVPRTEVLGALNTDLK